MKRIIGVILALVMMLSLSVPAWAVGEEEIIQKQASGADAVQEMMNQAIRNAGGVVGQINVKLHDQCIAFPDAIPENQNGRIMVPVRAVMEALGATVENIENKTVKISDGDTSITMAYGAKQVSVEKNGTTEQMDLDVASYLKQDRLYVPLRFVSEAFGYEVDWDQDYQSVIILDKAEIISKLDEQFSTINLFMKSYSKLLSQNYKTKSKITMDVELIDNIAGNKTYTATGTCNAHIGDGAISMDANLDLSEFAPMLDGFKKLAGDENGIVFDLIKPYMKKNNFEFKLDPEGNYYIKTELYDMIFSTFLGIAIDDTKDTWYLVSKIDPSLFTEDGYTVGNYLYFVANPQPGLQRPFERYETMMTIAEVMQPLMGNDAFQKRGNEYVWTFDKEKLLEIVGKEDEAMKQNLEESIQELSVTMSFNDAGVYSLEGAVKINMDGVGSLVSLAFEQNGSMRGGNSALELKVRNLFNLDIKTKDTVTKVTTAPDTSIPAEAQIIDLMQMFQTLI